MKAVEASTNERHVPALVRAQALIDLVARSQTALTVSELARLLNLPKSTVHGLCATLLHLGLLARRGETGLKVGPHVMRWANAFLAGADVTTEFAALWDSLNLLSGETITLSTLEGAEVVYLACRNSNAPLGLSFRIGMRLPAPFTATGKAILSTMSEGAVRGIMANRWPEPLTANSVRDVDSFLLELQETRERGFSIDNGQVRDGMWCFGTTVRNAENEVIAGVAVSMLSGQVDKPTTDLIARNIQRVANLLSIRLGANLQAPPIDARPGPGHAPGST